MAQKNLLSDKVASVSDGCDRENTLKSVERFTPELMLKRVRSKVTPICMTAFFSTLFVGLVAHAYAFLNNLPNHDAIANVYATQDITTSGRYFLQIACGITSYFNVPWLIGLASLVYLGMTAAVVVSIFEVRNKLNAFLISACIVAFPSVTATFVYMYTADGYMLSLFMAALSVYFAVKHRKGFFFSIPLLCLSLATYQASLSFAIVLYIFCIIFDILDGNDTPAVLGKFGKYLLNGVGGCVLYFVSLKVVLLIRGLTLTTYQGIDRMGFSIETIKSAFPAALKSFIGYFFSPEVAGRAVFFCAFAAISIILISVVMFRILSMRIYKRPVNLLLLPLLVCALPFAMCCIFFVSSKTMYYFLMCTSFSLLFAMIPVMCEKYIVIKGAVSLSTRWALVMLSLLFSVYFCVVSNVSYAFLELKNIRTQNVMVGVVYDLQRIADYSEKPIYLLYTDDEPEEGSVTTHFANTTARICMGFSQMCLPNPGYDETVDNFVCVTFRDYLKLYHNLDCTFMTITDLAELRATDAYSQVYESLDTEKQYEIVEFDGNILIYINHSGLAQTK